METGAYGLVLRPILGEKILGGGRSVHFTDWRSQPLVQTAAVSVMSPDIAFPHPPCPLPPASWDHIQTSYLKSDP